jgi:Ku70/Ku80 beta-barrel domain
MISREAGNRLKQQMIDAETGDVVDSDQKARGYELTKGEYVEIDKEELEAVQIESNHTIDIDSFVPKDEFGLSAVPGIRISRDRRKMWMAGLSGFENQALALSL